MEHNASMVQVAAAVVVPLSPEPETQTMPNNHATTFAWSAGVLHAYHADEWQACCSGHFGKDGLARATWLHENELELRGILRSRIPRTAIVSLPEAYLTVVSVIISAFRYQSSGTRASQYLRSTCGCFHVRACFS